MWIERFKKLGPIARDLGVLLVVKQHGGETGTGQACAEITREVGDEVAGRLDPDRQPDEIGGDAGRLLFCRLELGVGRRCRVDDQRPCVADVREVAHEARRLDEAYAGLEPTLDAEGYLSENQYDAAGRLSVALRYATLTATATRMKGTMALRWSATILSTSPASRVSTPSTACTRCTATGCPAAS